MNKYKKMLENASTIQYYKNVLDSCNDSYISCIDGMYYIVCSNYNYILPKQTALFLLKGRKLKGGLATPMQRYYAYRALGVSTEPRVSFECKLWSTEFQAFKKIKVEDILTYEQEEMLFF